MSKSSKPSPEFLVRLPAIVKTSKYISIQIVNNYWIIFKEKLCKNRSSMHYYDDEMDATTLLHETNNNPIRFTEQKANSCYFEFFRAHEMCLRLRITYFLMQWSAKYKNVHKEHNWCMYCKYIHSFLCICECFTVFCTTKRAVKIFPSFLFIPFKKAQLYDNIVIKVFKQLFFMDYHIIHASTLKTLSFASVVVDNVVMSWYRIWIWNTLVEFMKMMKFFLQTVHAIHYTHTSAFYNSKCFYFLSCLEYTAIRQWLHPFKRWKFLYLMIMIMLMGHSLCVGLYKALSVFLIVLFSAICNIPWLGDLR